MEALKLFSKYAPARTFVAIFFGALAGLLYALLIPVVMYALSPNEPSSAVGDGLIDVISVVVSVDKLAHFYLFVCVLILVLRCFTQVTLARLALDIRYRLRQALYRQIHNAPIASLEKVGHSRLIQALSTDVTVIVSGAKLFPQLLTNAVTLMGMLGYLAYLSVDIFTFVIKVIVFGVIAHQIPSWIGTRYFYRAREHRDVLQEAFKGLVEGAKELKLNDHKKRQFNDRVLDRQEQIVTGLDKKGSTVHALADNFGELLSFFAIGGLAFVFVDRNDIAASQVVGAVMVLLYITGPVSTLLNFIPQLASVRISLKKIDALYRELPDEQVCQTAKPLPSWQCLRFENVGYTYPSADNDPLDQQNPGFAVGPLNLEIKAGQITFITGGNGSGKSTLAKLVTAHYLADQGEIYCDQIKIERHNINALRQQIGCIYADYHLFEQLLDSRSQCPQYLERANHYLKAFGIDHKVSIENGRFTTLQLSDGQRRRLALVVAILDDKKLLLFDEWAADQDPQFKRVFYRQILADLKQQNKAVVVISHDDRYFDVADQIIVMEQGMSSSSDTVKQPNVSVDKADSKYRELEYNGENYNYEG